MTIIILNNKNKISKEFCIQDVPLQRPLTPLYPQVETNHFYVHISAQHMKVDIKMTPSSEHFFTQPKICWWKLWKKKKKENITNFLKIQKHFKKNEMIEITPSEKIQVMWLVGVCTINLIWVHKDKSMIHKKRCLCQW